MERRQFLRHAAGSAVAGGIASPAIVRAAFASMLAFVPYANLALADFPASALVTRHRVPMVFDALLALDAAASDVGGPTADGRLWMLALRGSLLLHEGAPVPGRDVVASLRRWNMPMLPLEFHCQPATYRADPAGMLKRLNLFTGVRRA